MVSLCLSVCVPLSLSSKSTRGLCCPPYSYQKQKQKKKQSQSQSQSQSQPSPTFTKSKERRCQCYCFSTATGVGVDLLSSVEPPNALSLPTWAIHVSSVVEWVIAMLLVWQYAHKSANLSWKALSWGMVPLLGGAMCACTWHFFYNAESLEILVALQAALTVCGNATMCIAAYRIYKSQSRS